MRGNVRVRKDADNPDGEIVLIDETPRVVKGPDMGRSLSLVKKKKLKQMVEFGRIKKKIMTTPRTTGVAYERMDPISHIHKRPDMYIGSLAKRVQPGEWVFEMTEKQMRFLKEPVYSDGLWRIFLEPISNVVDNVWRSKQAGVDCKKITVDIQRETGEIRIGNDGLSIAIEVNEASGLYNPELIFGNLLTSSNYNDEEDRLSSGRNGLGVKLTNVFSTRFSIECGDPDRGVIYSQTWTNHMRQCERPVIRKKKNKGYTLLSFTPDFSMFGMETLEEVMVGLYHKTCVDMAMVSRVPVFLNGEKIHLHNLKEYVQLYPLDTKNMIAWENKELQRKKEEQLEVVLCPAMGEEYHEVGFVNGIYNREGGIHVETVASELWKGLLAKINKGRSTHLFSVKDIRPHFFLFVNAWLVNPTFSNQSKTRLLSPAPRVNIESRFLQTICTKWGFMDKMNELLKMKEMTSLKKTEKKARGYHRIEGLDHANKAGGKEASDCTLILCEGLSAKTYAVTGIEMGWNGRRGRDYFGIFSLKGKLLNVRNATLESMSNNKEITAIIQALGLRYKTDYGQDAEFAQLQYGRVMIITDADVDGLHIASLIVNLFHVSFPSLLRREQAFLYWMMTPVAKIFRTAPTSTLTFYNDFDYQQALRDLTGVRFKVKYYKGLGTSSDEEVRETFGTKVVSFQMDEKTDASMSMVFSKKAANERKRWMEEYDPMNYVTPVDTYDITQFINQEHIKFSIDDCKRNIPNLYDGLKLSQRKILYSIFKKGLVPGGKSMKVAQLAGYVAENSNYHHGEQCLYDTITRMAQDFVGSNNVPLLAKDGQFGCLDPETEVLMADGTVRLAKTIVVGDELVGDDGKTRRVLRTVEGEDEMWEIVQSDGERYTVNQQHILTLYHKKSDSIQDWPLNKYRLLSSTMRMEFRVVSNSKSIEWSLSPETTTSTTQTETDQAYREGTWWPHRTTPIDNGRLLSSLSERREYLAGALDYSSLQIHNDARGQTRSIDVRIGSSDSKNLSFLARSLGFHVQHYQRSKNQLLRMTGDWSTIPTRRRCRTKFSPSPERRMVSFQVEPRGRGRFCGWQVDGNERFLLGNFVVTHNSRLASGHDAANGRYIFTKLLPLTRCLFPAEDDELVPYTLDDGDKVEPDYYVPILPLMLINGCKTGIGSGWSCSVPMYHPMRLVECVRQWLRRNDQETSFVFPPMTPYYHGFQGRIEPLGDNKFRSFGMVEEETMAAPESGSGKRKKRSASNESHRIREIPIDVSIDKYKEFLEKLLEEKKIKSMKNYSSPNQAMFCFTPAEGFTPTIESLNLTSDISLTNMVLFTETGRLQKYDTLAEIFHVFCKKRYEIYGRRKESMLAHLRDQWELDRQKHRFLQDVMEDRITVFRRSQENVTTQLHQHHYPLREDSYQYLLNIPVHRFTKEQLETLEKKLDQWKKEIQELESTTIEMLWNRDLDQFVKEYEKKMG